VTPQTKVHVFNPLQLVAHSIRRTEYTNNWFQVRA
jgi:hypothetical protein